MASRCSSNEYSVPQIQLSEYVKNLTNSAKSRYLEKLTVAGKRTLPDPYSIRNGWTADLTDWPDLTFGDIYTYLIETPGIYTKESLKAYKSLEGYR